MQKRIGSTFNNSIISFTFSVLVYSTLDFIGIVTPIGALYVIQLFLVCLAISFLHFCSYFLYENGSENISFIRIFIDISSVIACVFFLGGYLFKWFYFSFEQIVLAMGMSIIIYIFSFLFIYLQTKKDTTKINNVIKQRKGATHE